MAVHGPQWKKRFSARINESPITIVYYFSLLHQHSVQPKITLTNIHNHRVWMSPADRAKLVIRIEWNVQNYCRHQTNQNFQLLWNEILTAESKRDVYFDIICVAAEQMYIRIKYYSEER